MLLHQELHKRQHHCKRSLTLQQCPVKYSIYIHPIFLHAIIINTSGQELQFIFNFSLTVKYLIKNIRASQSLCHHPFDLPDHRLIFGQPQPINTVVLHELHHIGQQSHMIKGEESIPKGIPRFHQIEVLLQISHNHPHLILSPFYITAYFVKLQVIRWCRTMFRYSTSPYVFF